MPARGEGEFVAIEANAGSSLQRLCRLRRYRDFLASPLLRLLMELILKIFKQAILDNDNDGSSSASSGSHFVLLVLIAICYKLRKIGTTASWHLWSTVDLAFPSLSGLFLERCNYDPHLIIIRPSPQQIYPIKNSGGDVLLQLEGRTFNNLCALFFWRGII